eukprot:636948-Pleurochrysis_carterae.AAC.1
MIAISEHHAHILKHGHVHTAACANWVTHDAAHTARALLRMSRVLVNRPCASPAQHIKRRA